MSEPIVRRRITVTGKVQGVFFRDSTREKAESEGVAGWATNRDDGAVEAVLEGPAAAVEAVIDFCRQGPALADVNAVDVTEEPPEGLSEFRTR
ncbi:MAG: acylphosphatase [Solirubrobacterales bacterium]|nr:acylphosphatase [Solirubrobacterales bacterium]